VVGEGPVVTRTIRGADIVARSLERAGLSTLFTLSGNHIMPVFDAVLDTGLRMVHTRHEAAAVHMADAAARLTGSCQVALVTGGAGHTNAVAALCTAQAAEASVVLLSGHAGSSELGRGAFQELRQADMAAPVTKSSWTARSTATLGHEIAEAMRIARAGRPGPVNLNLPVDLLEAQIPDAPELMPEAHAFEPRLRSISATAADGVLAELAQAARPLILAGPTLCHDGRRDALDRLTAATGVPAIGMESPRGINDPCLGAFAEVLAEADLIVLLGKPHDFTLRFAEPPFVDPGCRLIAIDPEAALIERAARERQERLGICLLADARPAAATLAERAKAMAMASRHPDRGWRDEVALALAHRPAAWSGLAASGDGRMHPLAMCRALKPFVETSGDAILVCDGGEVGQWAQAVLKPSRRLINGVAGSIGASLPFALAARLLEPASPVIAVMGDGTFGFHMAELETAVRVGLPVVIVVGNDATWNAEYQIQLRTYGAERARGCELSPAARYDQVAVALGGIGERVTTEDGLAAAVAGAIASGRPAVIDVEIGRVAAPVIRR
jgi:acetolactate synthase-1/2/3 large subunit